MEERTKLSPEGEADMTLLSNIATTITSVDRFGQNYQLKVDRQKSWIGAFCTLVLGFFLLVYVFAKAQVWSLKNYVDISEVKSATYNIDETFSAVDHGFFVAAALTEYADSSAFSIEDQTYGDFYFEKTTWGFKTESPTRLYPQYTQILSNTCSQA